MHLRAASSAMPLGIAFTVYTIKPPVIQGEDVKLIVLFKDTPIII